MAVCQPLVVWLCANPQSYVPFNELILGWEIRSHSNSKYDANYMKLGHIGGKNRCFMTANTPQLRALLVLSKDKNRTLGTSAKTQIPLLL
jgi:hypothetical protein